MYMRVLKIRAFVCGKWACPQYSHLWNSITMYVSFIRMYSSFSMINQDRRDNIGETSNTVGFCRVASLTLKGYYDVEKSTDSWDSSDVAFPITMTKSWIYLDVWTYSRPGHWNFVCMAETEVNQCCIVENSSSKSWSQHFLEIPWVKWWSVLVKA